METEVKALDMLQIQPGSKVALHVAVGTEMHTFQGDWYGLEDGLHYVIRYNGRLNHFPAGRVIRVEQRSGMAQ